MTDSEEKYAIYGHLTAKDGKAATEVTPLVQSDEMTARGAVEQKIAIDKQRSELTYNMMLKSANEILFAAKTAFPFTFFPTKIVIDRQQVNIEHRIALGVANYHTFLLKDINNVQVTKGVLFSMIHFEVQGYEKNPPDINYLRNTDAEQIKKIIDGIHIAQTAQVDITQLEKGELLTLVKKITYQNNFNNAPV